MKNNIKLSVFSIISFFIINMMNATVIAFPNFSPKTYFDYPVLPLQGALDQILMFNSNSPEIIKTEGILLSTFPFDGMKSPEAHLNLPFEGRFDLFSHHLSAEKEKDDYTTIYQGIILQNLSEKAVNLRVLSGSSYTTQPDAPFKKLDDYLINNNGNFFSGPGDRVSQDILRGKLTVENRIAKIMPKEVFVLLNEPIPISPGFTVNARTSQFKLESDGPLYIADLALYQKKFLFFWKDQKPSVSDWLNILKNGNLSEKRDHIPTPVENKDEWPFFYGRVAGVQIGSKWESIITNDQNVFKIPAPNEGVSYALNTVSINTYGTSQVQSAKIIRRYWDTAIQANANYGVTYEISIPLYNANKEATSVAISFDSPLRVFKDRLQNKITFYDEPPEKVTFRGEFKIEYKSLLGADNKKYIHIVQRFGQLGLPLVSILMSPGEHRLVKITYVYPADATPPHVLTITSN